MVFKTTNPEVVRLQNVSESVVDLDNWDMCSINGNQPHDDIIGVLGPGEVLDLPYVGSGTIWDDVQRDDGALYNSGGRLVSYWVDQ